MMIDEITKVSQFDTCENSINEPSCRTKQLSKPNKLQNKFYKTSFALAGNTISSSFFYSLCERLNRGPWSSPFTTSIHASKNFAQLVQTQETSACCIH